MSDLVPNCRTQVILFRTPRGYMLSPDLKDVVNLNEDTLTQYENQVKNRYTILYTKRFESIDECKSFVKQDMRISEREFKQLFQDTTPKQLPDAPKDHTD